MFQLINNSLKVNHQFPTNEQNLFDVDYKSSRMTPTPGKAICSSDVFNLERVSLIVDNLTHFCPMFSFYTLENTRVFRGYKMETLDTMASGLIARFLCSHYVRVILETKIDG